MRTNRDAYYTLIRRSRQSRRKRLACQPLPEAWQQILQTNVAIYKRLPERLRTELHGHIQVFLDEKRFEG